MEIWPQVMAILYSFFDDDLDKIQTWLNAKNPNLGGISPVEMILAGRQDRLHKWMSTQMELNQTERLKK